MNATVACALAASYRKIPVIHVEAGLRSFDWDMPEEINRVVTDRLSDLLFITEPSARENLLKEGTPPEKIQFVGNVMVDTLLKHRERASQTSRILDQLQLQPGGYAVMTLHRPSNVDQKNVFAGILKAVHNISRQLKIVFTVHPRTRTRIEEFGLEESVKSLILLEPQPYLDMVHLMSQAKAGTDRLRRPSRGDHSPGCAVSDRLEKIPSGRLPWMRAPTPWSELLRKLSSGRRSK